MYAVTAARLVPTVRSATSLSRAGVLGAVTAGGCCLVSCV